MRKTLLAIIATLCLSLQAKAENITFADSNVKALCVANWDSNNDGEISFEEAASVTALGTVFREKTNISSFEELSYFTGLTTINDYAFYKSSIQNVSFPATVTSIGQYAFAQSKISDELCIPGNIKSIGNYAFNTCQYITRVVMDEGVETIGWHTFSGPIKSMLLPTTLNFMSSMAIDPYVNADPSSGVFIPDGDLYTYSHSTTPAQINEFAFYYVFAEGHLVVPHGLIETYKAEPGWSHFGEYLEFGDINMDGEIDNEDLELINKYIDGEADDDFNKDIADTNGDGTIDEEDVQNIADIISQGETTGIENTYVKDDSPYNGTSDVYNLNGQKVGTSLDGLPKGIYIVRGRKVLVK